MSAIPPRPKTSKRTTSTKLGRDRVYATDLPVYDSMEQCCGATGIPVAAQKHAKKNGCLFIRHGRVHLGEFIRWFFKSGKEDAGDDEMMIDWNKRDKRAAALIKEVKLEEEYDRLIDFAMVTRILTQLVNVTFFGELERLANEFPTGLKGKTEVQINEECLEQVKKIKLSLIAQLQAWEKSKGKI